MLTNENITKNIAFVHTHTHTHTSYRREGRYLISNLSRGVL